MSPPPLFPVDDPPRNRGDASVSREESSERWLRLHSFQPRETGLSRDETGDKTSNPTLSCSESGSQSRGEHSKRRKRAKRKERKERKEKRYKEEKKRTRCAARDDDDDFGIRGRDAKRDAMEERHDRVHRERRSQATNSSAMDRLHHVNGTYEDCHRDVDNATYGGLSRAVKFRRVIDLATQWYKDAAKIRGDFHGLQLAAKHEQKKERYFTRGAATRKTEQEAVYLRKSVSNEVNHPNDTSDFLKLSEGGCEERAHEDDFESLNARLMQKTKSYNENIHANPENVALWIEFAQFQDEFMTLTRKKVEISQMIEKKIAILEDALRYHPHESTLVIMLLIEYEKVEESPSIKSRWEYACAQNPGNPVIWNAFIRYCLRDFTNFSVDGVRKVYNNALSSLVSAKGELKRKHGVVSTDVAQLERAIVGLIIDICSFDIQAGSTELAVARMQAALEFCCLSPKTTQAEDELLDMFESFWECEEPRIGEPTATGWADWMTKNRMIKDTSHQIKSQMHTNQAPRQVPPPPPASAMDKAKVILSGGWEHFEEDVESEEEEVGYEGGDNDTHAISRLEDQLDSASDVEIDGEILRKWVAKEWKRSLKHWKPTRLVDTIAGEMDAPTSSKVCFDDVRDGLTRLEDELAREKLWTQTLRLVGAVETLPTDLDEDEHLILRESAFGPHREAFDLFSGRNVNQEVRSWFSSTDGLECAWLSAESGRRAFGSNVFRVFASHDPTTQSCRIVQTKEEAKELLAGYYGNSLKLWSHLAEMEWKSSRSTSARKIYSRAFQIAFSSKMQDISHLAFSWVNCELATQNYDNTDNVLKILLVLAFLGTDQEITLESVPTDAVSFLRADKFFKEKMIFAFEGGGAWPDDRKLGLLPHGVALILCFALFKRLTKRPFNDIDDAIRLIPRDIQQGEGNVRFWHELHLDLLQMRPIANRRSSIQYALKIFPSSPILLLKLCELELEVQGTQRMHRYLEMEFERKNALGPILYALGLEANKPFASNPRAVSIFERALEQTKSTAQSPMLWLMYMRAYLESGQLSSAKTVFLRAINAVPWNKTLWLIGIDSLQKVFTVKERVSMLDLMREKGISVRTDIFEIQLEACYQAQLAKRDSRRRVHT